MDEKKDKEICSRCNFFFNSLKNSKASSVVSYQLIKSVTSTAANYRAACRARSKKEFFSKICIVVEEADETEF
ncbi:four helix bundle protein [Candidatus Marifrigoribacter sp. Uisw_064]|uniref:four helix bundle protein n=1 Tax=Candidatus Marifrigoribacter sp. Uisw_064 TaxID=3230970 RepID=UPI003D3F2299